MMFRKVGVLLIGTSLLFILVGAGRLAKKEVELNLVWEKEFDKKIEEVVFGETEDGKLYPKIVVFEDEVRFYDESFGLIRTWPRTRGTPVTISEGGHYFGLERVVRKPVAEKGTSEVEWTLYNDKYEERAIVRYNVGYDGEGGRLFYISDSDGAFVEAEQGDQQVAFYDPEGGIRKRVNLFMNDHWDIGKGIEGAYSENGDYFALVGCNQYFNLSRQFHTDIYLILFSNMGEELWRRFVDNERVKSLSLSSKGKFVLANGHSLFDRNGKLIGTYPATRRHHKFAKDEKHLVLAGENTVCLIETSNGNILWSKELPYQIDSRKKEWRWITQLDVSENEVFIGIIDTLWKRREKGFDAVHQKISLLNNKGEVIFEREIHEQQGKAFLRLSPDGREMYLRTLRELATFSIVEK